MYIMGLIDEADDTVESHQEMMKSFSDLKGNSKSSIYDVLIMIISDF